MTDSGGRLEHGPEYYGGMFTRAAQGLFGLFIIAFGWMFYVFVGGPFPTGRVDLYIVIVIMVIGIALWVLMMYFMVKRGQAIQRASTPKGWP
jgi:hypothetical protein